MQITDNNLYFPHATQWTKNKFYVLLLGLKGVQIFVTGYSICQNRPVTEYSYVDTEVPAIVQVPVDSDAHGESSFCFHSPVQNITLSVLLGGHSR